MAQLRIGPYQVHMEFSILLVMFAMMLADSVLTNLVIYRTCYVILGYSKSECALLGTSHTDNKTAELEKLVEPHANILKLTNSITEQLVSVFICLFIGPWSDRFGRKPILTFPIAGMFLSYLLLIVFAAIPNLTPWFLMFSSLPTMLTGGFATYLTACLSYVTDVTTETNRGLRMGSFEAVLGIGVLLGNVCSSYILYATSYWALFLISAICLLVALLFNIFFIEESLLERETEGKLKGFFQFSNVKSMIRTTFRKREHFKRCVVMLCLLSLVLLIFVVLGEGGLTFMYLREKFHWPLQKYTLYSAGHNVASILGTIVGVYVLHKVLKVPETILILMGYISLLNSSLMKGLATKDYTIYAAAVVQSVSGALSPMTRSLVSKIVPSEEVGKIFSLIMTSEFLFGLGASTLYTTIYNETIDFNPGIFLFVSAGIYFVQVLIAIALIVIRTWDARNSQNLYEEMINDEEIVIHE